MPDNSMHNLKEMQVQDANWNRLVQSRIKQMFLMNTGQNFRQHRLLYVP
jgi:hypothetical protein